jgi:hypothetical protein
MIIPYITASLHAQMLIYAWTLGLLSQSMSRWDWRKWRSMDNEQTCDEDVILADKIISSCS